MEQTKSIIKKKVDPCLLRERKRRYDLKNRTEIGKPTRCRKVPWRCYEGLLVMVLADMELSDRWLSLELNRSINAIQKMRHRIHTGEVALLKGIYVYNLKAVKKTAQA